MSQHPTNYDDLPEELKIQILSFMNLKSLLNFRLLSKEDFRVSQNKLIWNPFCSQVFGDGTISFDVLKTNYKRGFLKKETISLRGENSKFVFERRGWASIFLMIGEEAFFNLGNQCDSLSEWFEKIEDFEEIKETLNYPILTMEEKFLSKIGSILPKGEYKVANYLVNPTHVKPNSKSDYFSNVKNIKLFEEDKQMKSDYYQHQFKTQVVIDKIAQHHFFFPMQSTLNDEIVKDYEKIIENGILPAVFCLSFYFQYKSMDYVKGNGESILVSLILDGHHKMKASSNLNKSVRVLNFVYNSEFNPMWESTVDPTPFLEILTGEK
jgi:hypothetical protein